MFCSDKCKTRYFRENQLTCFYCGDMASTKDHMYPQKFGDGKGDTVPACGECNATLGAVGPESVEARFMHLHAAYIKKYNLNKAIPEWTDAEVDELGHSLRSAVKNKIRARQNAIERVTYIKEQFKRIGGRYR